MEPSDVPDFVREWYPSARETLIGRPPVVTERMKERIRAAKWWQSLKAKHWIYRTDDDCREAFDCWLWMGHLNRRGVA